MDENAEQEKYKKGKALIESFREELIHFSTKARTLLKHSFLLLQVVP